MMRSSPLFRRRSASTFRRGRRIQQTTPFLFYLLLTSAAGLMVNLLYFVQTSSWLPSSLHTYQAGHTVDSISLQQSSPRRRVHDDGPSDQVLLDRLAGELEGRWQACRD